MPEKDDKPPPPPPWTPEQITTLLKAIEPFADKYLQFTKEKAEAYHKLARLGVSHDWRVVTVSFAFLSALTILMSWLTAIGRVSGDALLFLAGTITGYIFSLIIDFSWQGPPATPEKPEESS